ncbi:aldo/keto reductase [Streptomyces sp. NPDC051642]|uniref:aldo/keto reductase n=1 Tax=unclassified Streptomyces TaxID=2593676 RepID=UPI0034331E55
MRTTTWGRAGLTVSRIAFGTWQLGGDRGVFAEDEAEAAIRRARELGVNTFDTAQAYGFGASERLLGSVLRDELRSNRDELVNAGKGGLRRTDTGVTREAGPRALREGVDASPTALGVDHIDLHQVHWPAPKVRFADTAGAQKELVDSGKIRHVGVSNFNAEQMARFSEVLPVKTPQPPYHLFRREIEDTVLPHTRQQDIGVLVHGPLAHGLLTGTFTEETVFPAGNWRSRSGVFEGETYRRNLTVVREPESFAASRAMTISQSAISWTLAHSDVHVAIVGTRHVGHVEDSLAAVDITLGDTDLKEIDSIMAAATPVAGPSRESV